MGIMKTGRIYPMGRHGCRPLMKRQEHMDLMGGMRPGDHPTDIEGERLGGESDKPKTSTGSSVLLG